MHSSTTLGRSPLLNLMIVSMTLSPRNALLTTHLVANMASLTLRDRLLGDDVTLSLTIFSSQEIFLINSKNSIPVTKILSHSA